MQSPVEAEENLAVVEAVRPRPGIGFSLVWIAVLMGVQIAVATGIVAVAAISYAFRGERPGLGDLVESTVIPTLLIGTLANLLVAIAAVTVHCRRGLSAAIALRPVSAVHTVLVLLTAVPLAVVASEVANWAAEVLPKWNLNTPFLEALARQPWMLLFIGGCLLPGVGEEILFRGFIGRGLVARYGVVAGVLITSVLFGLVHLQPVQVCAVIVIGAALHLVFLSSKSLVAPIVLHALNNVIAFSSPAIAKFLPIPGFTVSSPHEGEVLHAPALLVAVSVLVLSALAWMFYETRTRWMTPQEREWSPGYATAEAPPELLQARPNRAAPSAGNFLLCGLSYIAFATVLVMSATATP